MKKIVFLFSLFLLGAFFVGKTQTITYTPQTAAGYQFKYLKADSGIAIPLIDTSLRRGVNRIGAMVARPQDSVIYFWNGKKWGKVSTDITGLTALINAKVDSLTVSGSILYYWKNGVAYGVSLSLLSGTLQTVTDNGSVTTNSITVNNLQANGFVNGTQTGPGGFIFRTNVTNTFADSLKGYIQGDSLQGTNRTWQLPDTSGVFALSVNGTKANKNGNVVVSVGTVTSVSGVAPIEVNSFSIATPVISMKKASATDSGWVSSADWTTFNGKESVLTFSSPLVRTTNTISIPVATTSVNGYLSSTDWTTFNNKQGTITLTTTGTSGAATFSANTLNIPNYGSALSGYLPLTGGTLTGALGGTSASFSGNITTSGTGNILIQAASSNNFPLFQLLDTRVGGNTWNIEGGRTLGNLQIRSSIAGGTVLEIASTGAATFSSSATATSFIPSGATVPTNGMYLSAANTLNFATNTTNRLTIFSTGNLAINSTTDAGYKLDVNGTGRFVNGVNMATTSGSVGIGTTSPQSLLHLTHANPILLLEETDQIADAKRWGIQSETSILKFRAFNDALTTAVDVVSMTRTGSVGIGTTTPASSSLLDVTSTTKGFLPPRMTTTEINAIASPAAGLVVYNTTLAVLCFYDGTGWKRVVHLAM